MTTLRTTATSLYKKFSLGSIIAIIGLVGFLSPLANAASQPVAAPPHNLRGMELFDELNRIRGLYHLAPLAVNQALGTSAQRKCADMVNSVTVS